LSETDVAGWPVYSHFNKSYQSHFVGTTVKKRSLLRLPIAVDNNVYNEARLEFRGK